MILFSKGTGKTYRRKTCNLSQEGRQPACSMVGKQRASQGAGIPQEGKHRSTKPWFNLGIFKIHRHLRLQGKPNGNSKILTEQMTARIFTEMEQVLFPRSRNRLMRTEELHLRALGFFFFLEEMFTCIL